MFLRRWGVGLSARGRLWRPGDEESNRLRVDLIAPKSPLVWRWGDNHLLHRERDGRSI
jgi:hypothetical protein